MSVSTHSRPKAAGSAIDRLVRPDSLFQHTAARRRLDSARRRTTKRQLFQHTAARRRLVTLLLLYMATGSVSTHSRPKAAGERTTPLIACSMFQHTAARRRLVFILSFKTEASTVSTHSRPKAAGTDDILRVRWTACFNTQPPEGGWVAFFAPVAAYADVSTHSRPKAAGLW